MTPTPEEQASLRRTSSATLLGGAILTMVAMGIGLFGVTVLAQTGRQTFQAHQTVGHITLNAVVNNPTHGDERNFVLIREVGGGEFTDEVTLQPGREYEVYNYYHNNASATLNASGKGLATDVRLRVLLPAVVQPSTTASIVGTLSSPEAVPTQIEDSVSVTTEHPVQMSFVAGSAVVHSNGPVNSAVLPDTLVKDGALLGFDRLDGVLPGGTEHAGYILYRVAVSEADCHQVACSAAVVTELPKTGVEQTVSTVMSSMLLVASVMYYIASRRARRVTQSGETTTVSTESIDSK